MEQDNLGVLIRVASVPLQHVSGLDRSDSGCWTEQAILEQVDHFKTQILDQVAPLLPDSHLIKSEAVWNSENRTLSRSLKKLRPLWRLLARSTFKPTPRGNLAFTTMAPVKSPHPHQFEIDTRHQFTKHSLNWHLAHRVSRTLPAKTFGKCYAVNPSAAIIGQSLHLTVVNEDGSIIKRKIQLNPNFDDQLRHLMEQPPGFLSRSQICPSALTNLSEESQSAYCQRLVDVGILFQRSDIPFACDAPFSHLQALNAENACEWLSMAAHHETQDDLEYQQLDEISNRLCDFLDGSDSLRGRRIVSDVACGSHGALPSHFVNSIVSETKRFVRLAHELSKPCNLSTPASRLSEALHRRFSGMTVPLSQIQVDVSSLWGQYEIDGASFAPQSPLAASVSDSLRGLRYPVNEAGSSLNDFIDLGILGEHKTESQIGFEAVVRAGFGPSQFADIFDGTLSVSSVGYPGTLTSRFSYLHNNATETATDRYLARLYEAHSNCIVAEVAIEPRGLVLNLTRRARKQIHTLELWGSLSSTYPLNSLGINDLAVDFSGPHPMLIEQTTKRRVLVTCRTALIPNDEPFFFMVMNFGAPHAEPVNIDWMLDWCCGTGEGFTPRITSGCLVLKPARWLFDVATLRDLLDKFSCRSRKISRIERSRRCLEWCVALSKEFSIPRFSVYKCGRDKRNLLDLETCFSVDSFAAAILANDGPVLVEELVPTFDQQWLRNQRGECHASEIVIQGMA